MNRYQTKLLIIFGIFSLGFILVLIRTLSLQTFNSKALKKKFNDQVFRELKVYPNRGEIYDREGSPLAINVRSYSIFVIPKELDFNNSSLKKISKIIPELSYKKLKQKVKNRKKFTWIKRRISLTKNQIDLIQNTKGIYYEEVSHRYYPNNELASQIIGFVGVDNTGLAGLEYKHDEKLRGSPKVLRYLIDNKGRTAKFERKQKGKEPQSLYLSIDKEIQSFVEHTLKESIEISKSEQGGVGVMNVKTGEILAMANYPTFDPNKLKESSSKFRKLSFVTDPIEPGSIFKIFTIAAALKNKIVNKDTNYNCEAKRFKIGKHFIKESDTFKRYGWLTVKDIIKYSSNIGTTKIAFDLGYDRFIKFLKKIRIGEKTGIELPGESRGIFLKEKKSLISLSNMSFGQGIATSGLQMLAAYGAIANDGIYVKPTIFKTTTAKKQKKILSSELSKNLTDILVETVEEGTGSNAKIPYFKIAGKTSTAQRPSLKGGYEGYVSGFIGFPVNAKNKFVVYAYLENSKAKYFHGNAIAAPLFKKIAQYILYKNEEVRNLNSSLAQRNSKAFDLIKIKHSSSKKIKKGEIPDFLGLDKVSVEKIAKKYKIKTLHRGSGVVVEQVFSKKNNTLHLSYEIPLDD